MVNTVEPRTISLAVAKSTPSMSMSWRDALKEQEGGMAFVEMVDGGDDFLRLKQSDATDAEDDLLFDASLG